MNQPVQIGNQRVLLRSRFGRSRFSRFCWRSFAFNGRGVWSSAFRRFLDTSRLKAGLRTRLPLRFDFNDRRRGRRRKGFDQMPPRAFRMRVDVADDASDAFRNRRGFEVEELRTGDGNMGEGPIDLEEMQAVRGELPAEEGGQLQRKIFLPFPSLRTSCCNSRHRRLRLNTPPIVCDSTGLMIASL